MTVLHKKQEVSKVIVKLIELARGKIWVESEGIGKGSKFSFTLKTV